MQEIITTTNIIIITISLLTIIGLAIWMMRLESSNNSIRRYRRKKYLEMCDCDGMCDHCNKELKEYCHDTKA